MPDPSSKRRGFSTALVVTAFTALGLGLLMGGIRAPRHRPPDTAPGRAARRSLFGDRSVSGQSVTIARPKAEVYAFWRDFSNLAGVLDGIESIEPGGDGSWVWMLSGPAGTRLRLVARIVHEREGEILAWKSTPGSAIEHEGKVEFRDAPGGRGTVVTAVISWRPPGGRMGQIAASLLRLDPATRSRHDLKRVKMLMEAGEIATSRNTRAQ